MPKKKTKKTNTQSYQNRIKPMKKKRQKTNAEQMSRISVFSKEKPEF